MSDFDTPTDVLYERPMPAGPLVRVRRISEPGAVPVVAVLEVDRRAASLRPSRGGGTPPPLLLVEGPSADDVIAQLRPHADNDAILARMMVEKGVR